MLSICQNIAHYRKLCGYTQEQLAEQLGVTAQSVSKWENGITNPDISLLPALAKSLSVDINALFSDIPHEPKKVYTTELPQLCFDAVISLFLKAQRTFYGIKQVETDEKLQGFINKLKKDFDFPKCSCACMIDEGSPEHGAVFLSDAFTFIDRSYGGTESAVLFDLDKAGEMLSVLGDKNARRVLKVIYKRLIENGEAGTFFTPEKLADETGLTAEAVNDAAIRLRHIGLLDENEKTLQNGYKKEYCALYPDDFIYVLAILRLAYIHTSDMVKSIMMYRDANNYMSYDGEALHSL